MRESRIDVLHADAHPRLRAPPVENLQCLDHPRPLRQRGLHAQRRKMLLGAGMHNGRPRLGDRFQQGIDHRTRPPCRTSSHAATSPTGPAPTTRTGASAFSAMSILLGPPGITRSVTETPQRLLTQLRYQPPDTQTPPEVRPLLADDVIVVIGSLTQIVGIEAATRVQESQPSTLTRRQGYVAEDRPRRSPAAASHRRVIAIRLLPPMGISHIRPPGHRRTSRHAREGTAVAGAVGLHAVDRCALSNAAPT